MRVYNLCRICLTEDINTSTLQPLFEEDGTSREIVQRIEVCGGIVVKPDEELPKMICAQCLDKLNVSYEFRSMCQASANALLDSIVKSEMKQESQDYDISKIGEDNDNELFYDMHTEFIDAQKVHLDGINEESDMEPNVESAEEFIEYSDSECFEEELSNTVKRKSKSSILNKKKTTNAKTTIATSTGNNSVRKQGKSKVNQSAKSIKRESDSGKKSNRDKKKKDESEGVNIKTEPKCEKNSSRSRKKKDKPKKEGSIICEICGNIYPKPSLLTMHMRRHDAIKRFECEICGRKFVSASEISRHMRIHTGERPYVCKYCGRAFNDQSTHIKHERIHTNERPFKCQTCGKSFTYSNVLKNHMLTHTGEKPFACEPCNKTFTCKHQLNQHIATITHQQTVGSGTKN